MAERELHPVSSVTKGKLHPVPVALLAAAGVAVRVRDGDPAIAMLVAQPHLRVALAGPRIEERRRFLPGVDRVSDVPDLDPLGVGFLVGVALGVGVNVAAAVGVGVKVGVGVAMGVVVGVGVAVGVGGDVSVS